jgi:squalene-hopene/tetraprenyl-beta-curcumene cyclase
VATEALLACDHHGLHRAALSRGLQWLVEAVLAGRHRDCSPIGFYFAKLWYYEKLYPMMFTVAALGRAIHRDEI